MSDDVWWKRLPLADQLRLVAFEAILHRFPAWMIGAIYEAAAQLDGPSKTISCVGRARHPRTWFLS